MKNWHLLWPSWPTTSHHYVYTLSFFHRPACLHIHTFRVSSCSSLRCQCCFCAIVGSFELSIQLAINAPTQTAHVTSGARHCACARITLHFRRARDDGYCPGIRCLIDRTRFKCYRSLMPIWPVHLNAASKSRIIARNCRGRRATYRPRSTAAVFRKDSASTIDEHQEGF